MKYTDQAFQLSPSDITNHLGCKHLTNLNKRSAMGEMDKPDWTDPHTALLQQKGQEHEDAYLAHLKAMGKSVEELQNKPYDELHKALRRGAEVITQPTFREGVWFGRADFLIRKEGKSDLGDYHYEVQDTKLAQNTRATTILQLCLYSEILGKLQGRDPEKLFVVKPGADFPTEAYQFAEFRAYYNLVKAKLQAAVADPPETQPLPVAKCGECAWWKHCDRQWHEADHLSLIAGIRSGQLKELENQSFETLEAYASFDQPYRDKPAKGNPLTYDKIHGQAQIQLKGRREERLLHELLDIEDQRGLHRLPAPSKGDIYFDIEGDHFYEDGGMEYLLGWVCKEGSDYRYHPLWARNRKEEKAAFQQFIDTIMARWEKYPDMYIYHYAPYEPGAMKRLAMRHATREEEVDKLLRAERFIDLYRVIRESLQASVESYSLKEMEQFTDYERKAPLQESAAARRRFGTALELDAMDQIPQADYDLIADYNEDDCWATLYLHQWIEDIYQQAVADGHKLTRPENKTGDASDKVDEMGDEARKLFDALTSDIPEEPKDRSKEQKARWLLAHMIEYWRRENKNQWWEYFRLHELEVDELLDDRDGIAYLTFESREQDGNKLPIDHYSFPGQEVAIGEGDEVVEPMGETIGKVVAISTEKGWVRIKKRKVSKDIHPAAVHIRDIFDNQLLQSALYRFAQEIIQHGFTRNGHYDAGKDLLLRQPPNLSENTILRQEEETPKDAAVRIAPLLQNAILPIQGPPGTGKTYTGAHMILHLWQQNQKIGVTAVSHKAIQNLLLKVKEEGEKAKIEPPCAHKGDVPKDKQDQIKELDSNDAALEAATQSKVVGATAFVWAREEAQGVLDYLFVDEAGQMALSYVLALSGCARNIILLGDPQQLEQPQQGAHPEGADVSALSHLLEEGHPTILPDKGLFLDTTWRLPPDITSYTSEIFYENRLKAHPDLSQQQIQGHGPWAGSGLRFLPVAHEGNQNQSPEEVEAIAALVSDILAANLRWQDREGKTQPIGPTDILIVAPYNSQVNALKDRLPHQRIGTVDKFQGQEAPIVIYSMTSSSPEDAPRGMGFLYSPNRLNVATSRAQCLCILVASPQLLEPDCHSIDQMRWANALCRYGELTSREMS